MANIVEIQSLDHKELEPYFSLTTRESEGKLIGTGIFIAESPKVIKIALEEGYRPLSLLCERRHIEGDASEIISSLPSETTVYTGSRELLSQLTGYTLTRGVLCAMYRKPTLNPHDICSSASTVAVLESVCDTTNIGSIFRSAAALGIDGILLTPDSCDPLNRRSVRVSMGSVFKIPWTFCDDPVTLLNNAGFTTIAMTLHSDSVPINDTQLAINPRRAIVLGTEGDGLTPLIISKCRYKAVIPMHRNVDSLNVGNAAAIAFWQLKSG